MAKPKCAGKSRQTGLPCKRGPTAGSRYCKFHGGRIPKGADSPRYKHGRYSRHLPSNLAQKYGEALADPDLMELRDEVALLHTRLCQLIESGESLPLWDKTAEAYADLRQAMVDKDDVAIAAGLSLLENYLRRGKADSMRWREIYQTVNNVTRIKEREHKRAVALQQMMTLEQFMLIIGKIADIARKTITNKDDLKQFTQELDGTWSGVTRAENTSNH